MLRRSCWRWDFGGTHGYPVFGCWFQSSTRDGGQCHRLKSSVPDIDQLEHHICSCPRTTGWWFGTMEFYDFPYPGNVIIPTDELIFFRGVGIPGYTTNQTKCVREFSCRTGHINKFINSNSIPSLTCLQFLGWQLSRLLQRWSVPSLFWRRRHQLTWFHLKLSVVWRCLKSSGWIWIKDLASHLETGWFSNYHDLSLSYIAGFVWQFDVFLFVSQSEIHHFRDVFVVCSLSNSSIVHFFWMFLDYCWNPVVGLTWLIPWCFLARRRARAAGDQVSSFSKMICCRDIKARETTVLTIHTQEYEFICTHCTPWKIWKWV